MKKPMPSPLCMRPAPLARALSGQISEIIEEPVAHSDPTATPTRKRSAAKDHQLNARADRPVISE